jgi:hypothetical protein
MNSSRRRWRAAVVLAGVVMLVIVGYRGCAALVHDESNKPAALALAAATEAHHREHGRYPARLEDLVPGQLAALPSSPTRGLIAYGRSADATQCWIAYSVHRDYFEEYDCRLRAWNLREYEETQALKHQPRFLRVEPPG